MSKYEDFGKKIFDQAIFGGARHHLIADVHAECAHQFLTCTLKVHKIEIFLASILKFVLFLY